MSDKNRDGCAAGKATGKKSRATKHALILLPVLLLLAAGAVIAVAADVTSQATVVIEAERQESGDVHIGLRHADGTVISPGEDNIFRGTATRASSSPISVETTRQPLMDSERVVSGRGERAGTIMLSPGLWLCSTTFNTIKLSRWSEADFHLVIGTEQYGDPTVGYSFYGSGTPFLIVAGDTLSRLTSSVPANVELALTPVEARSGHRWKLYCNRVQHRP